VSARQGRAKGEGKPAYKRALLKLTGQAFASEAGGGIDLERVEELAAAIARVVERGVELAIVVGGGNLFKGAPAEGQGIDRVTGDYVGMLATCMNGLCLQAALEALGVEVRLQSAPEVVGVTEPVVLRRAREHLSKGRVVIFAGGTGNPFFTTDTGAALRAVQIGAEVLLKGTDVEGVYSGDPHREAGAQLLERVTYDQALSQGLRVMDLTAFSLAKESALPIVVFDVQSAAENIERVIMGEKMGTLVCAEEEGKGKRRRKKGEQ